MQYLDSRCNLDNYPLDNVIVDNFVGLFAIEKVTFELYGLMKRENKHY